MKRIDFPRFSIALLALLAMLCVASASAQVKNADDIEYPALPQAEIPQAERVELDNGMVVILLEDHELPLIDVRAVIRTGSRLEPADKVGLAGLVGQVMRSGGTESVPSDELDDLLEDRAASIETSIGTTNGNANMSSLRDDFPEMLRVFADVLRNPAFEQDKIDVAKTLITAGIARQNDDPNQIIGREFPELVYGSDSPYTRSATYTTIDNITRDDLLAWHGEYFHPNRIILGLVGDFDSKDALKQVREVFGDWSAGPKVDDPQAAFREQPDPGIFFIEKTDLTQSFIRMGHLGITRDNPDYHAVELMNQVLSGSFASRLFSRIRSQKGLAYTVRGRVGSQWDYPGLSMLWMSTKTETTAAGIDALLEEVANMKSEPATDEEVEKAKAGILNSFVFNADSASKILAQQLTYEYFGFPLDWLDRYRNGIESTSTAEVRSAAEKYLHPEQFAILVVGKEDGMDRPLSSFGEVRAVDITIPEPEVEAVEATAESEQKGRELIAKAVEGIGGADKLAAFETWKTSAKMEVTTPQGAMQVSFSAHIALPGRMRVETRLPFGAMVQVLNGDSSYAQTPGGTQALPEAARQDLEKNLRRLTPVLLQHRDHDGFKVVAAGPGEVDGTAVEMVQIEIEGDTVKVGIEPESGKIRSIGYRGTNFMGAPGELVQSYSDFRDVGGLILPFASTTTFNGEPMLTGTIESSEINVEVEDSTFEMPAS